MNIKHLLLKDYTVYNAKRILQLRRKIQDTHSKLLLVVRKRRYNRMLFKNQTFLPLSKNISNDIEFPHGLSGIFISNGAKINNGCTIFQQVTIGSNAIKGSKTEGYPIIGKNCYIGAGAKIIGNVKIGDNVRVGAGTIVTKDVPDNTTVVGGGGLRLIAHAHKLDNRFVSYDGKRQNDKK